MQHRRTINARAWGSPSTWPLLLSKGPQVQQNKVLNTTVNSKSSKQTFTSPGFSSEKSKQVSASFQHRSLLVNNCSTYSMLKLKLVLSPMLGVEKDQCGLTLVSSWAPTQLLTHLPHYGRGRKHKEGEETCGSTA